MEWINLHTATLDSERFLGSNALAQVTWLKLLRFCTGQENGGRIVGARLWPFRRWLNVVRVSRAEVFADTLLWVWEGDDLLLEFYPTHKEELVQRNREAGRAGGKSKSSLKIEVSRVNGAKHQPKQNPSGTQAPDPSNNPTEGKGREGKGREPSLTLPEGRGEREADQGLDGFVPPVVVTKEMVRKWQVMSCELGSDVKESEALDGWQFFHQGRDPQTGMWRMGRTTLHDWRTALERQVTRSRERSMDRVVRPSVIPKKNGPPPSAEEMAAVVGAHIEDYARHQALACNFDPEILKK